MHRGWSCNWPSSNPFEIRQPNVEMQVRAEVGRELEIGVRVRGVVESERVVDDLGVEIGERIRSVVEIGSVFDGLFAVEFSLGVSGCILSSGNESSRWRQT